MLSRSTPKSRPHLAQAMKWGAVLRCPNCGQGHLYRSFLKPVDECAVCHERLGDIRADDGPAWLTVLVVGHIIVALMLALEPHAQWPVLWSMIAYPCLAIVMVLAFLPVAKGLFIAIIWSGSSASPT